MNLKTPLQLTSPILIFSIICLSLSAVIFAHHYFTTHQTHSYSDYWKCSQCTCTGILETSADAPPRYLCQGKEVCPTTLDPHFCQNKSTQIKLESINPFIRLSGLNEMIEKLELDLKNSQPYSEIYYQILKEINSYSGEKAAVEEEINNLPMTPL